MLDASDSIWKEHYVYTKGTTYINNIVYVEDGKKWTSTSASRYGNRNDPQNEGGISFVLFGAALDVYSQNRANGCTYEMNDYPGIYSISDSAFKGFRVNLNFVLSILDTCNNNVVKDSKSLSISHEWTW